uniref:Uncharacterized protein n=1 Tax=Columba livia TaxID=8932 RepID=R7VR75_COLLI
MKKKEKRKKKEKKREAKGKPPRAEAAGPCATGGFSFGLRLRGGPQKAAEKHNLISGLFGVRSGSSRHNQNPKPAPFGAVLALPGRGDPTPKWGRNGVGGADFLKQSENSQSPGAGWGGQAPGPPGRYIQQFIWLRSPAPTRPAP